MFVTQEQRSLDWFRARLGMITGSNVGTLMKTGRSKDKLFSDTASSYLYQLAGERILNRELIADDEMFGYFLDQTTTSSKAMRFGTEQEASARKFYAQSLGYEVEEVGLCVHPSIPYFASSPDGMVNDNGTIGCVEIKCPNLNTFAKYCAEVFTPDDLLKVNPDYYYQCQSHMACTGASFCDFIVFCPFVETPIHVVRIPRNDEAISNMLTRVHAAENIIQANSQLLNPA